MIRSFAAALVLTISATSLSAQEAASEATKAYYPIEVGASWTYEVLGSPIVMKATKTEKIGDEECFRIETLVNDKPVAYEHVAVKEDGVYRYTINGQKPEKPVCFLKFGKAGEKWQIDTKVQSQEVKGEFTLSEEAKEIKVGEQSYKGVMKSEGKNFKIAGQETDIAYWFAKDVGIVKLCFSLDGQEVELMLKEYTPASKPK